ncbi:hypothetical protein F52700_4086 [Fusarium sp. NRRL 52700]|nr:hypothetical protein F52700_4086 [Fusarium sp. NRRL 52700]
MTLSQASGHLSCSDPFCALQPEINIQVLEYLSILDIQSAMASSPMLLRILESNRQYILRPYLRELRLSYGGVSSFRLAAAAMHLRELHSKHNGNTITALKREVEHVLGSILRLNIKTNKEMGNISLCMIIAAQEILPEIIDAFTKSPWEAQQGELLIPFLNCRRMSGDTLWLNHTPLAIRTALSDGFLRFDCYRSIFYHKGQDLFQERARIKDTFLDSFPKLPTFDYSIRWTHPHNILSKIRLRYERLLRNINDPFPPIFPAFVSSTGARNEVLPTMLSIDYTNRTGIQHDYFLHRLVLQGYPKLVFFENLSHESRLSTMMDEFQELVVSNPEDVEAWAALTGFYVWDDQENCCLAAIFGRWVFEGQLTCPLTFTSAQSTGD